MFWGDIIQLEDDMNDRSIESVRRKTTADYKSDVGGILDELQRLNDLMREDTVQIDQLKAETEVLQAETNSLRHESRTILARLGVTL